MSDPQLPDDSQAIADMDYSPESPSETWKDIIRPATIFQILHAESSPIFEDKSLVIDGRGFGAVTLVAHVTSVDRQPGGMSYLLEDGTGRIHAVKDLSSLLHYRGLSPEVERKEVAQSLALEHTFVEVIGNPQKGNPKWGPRLKIKSIWPIHDYHHVMYHILNVIHSNILIQQHVQPYGWQSNADCSKLEPQKDLGDEMLVDDDQPIPCPHPSAILPNSFLPQRQQPYGTLEPLERAIMAHIHHNKDLHVSVEELAQAIQTSCGCTGSQFHFALQALLAEAYLTSPLDDGYVVLTPRY